MPDSGHLQELEADYANRHGFSRHKPALPLYTKEDAERALAQFRPVAFDEAKTIAGGASIRLRCAGHILGAAFVEFAWGSTKTVFSGDLGRFGDPVMPDPVAPSVPTICSSN